MPCVGQICRLRARGRRTSGKGCSGVPTPDAHPDLPNSSTTRENGRQARRLTVQGLGNVAKLAGVPTVSTEDHKTDGPKTRQEYQDAISQGRPIRQSAQRLRNHVLLAGSATPNTCRRGTESKQSKARRPRTGGIDLQTQALGATGWPCPTPTASTGALNPEYSRWLMGFPAAWAKAIPGHRDWTAWQKLAQASAERNATERSQSQDTATP